MSSSSIDALKRTLTKRRIDLENLLLRPTRKDAESAAILRDGLAADVDGLADALGQSLGGTAFLEDMKEYLT